MFDPVTSSLIQQAPNFDGLDLEALPKQLTEAFAEVVAARIRLRGEGPALDDGERAEKDDMLARLAAANEAYATLLPDRDNRAAAAFVAASAYQALTKNSATETSISQVSADAVAPEIAATLLFLIAEAHADAAEMAKRIIGSAENDNRVEAALLSALQYLAQGRLRAVERLDIPFVQRLGLSASSQALQALQLELFKGVQRLAWELLNRLPAEPPIPSSTSSGIFRSVQALSSEAIDLPETDGNLFSLFPGPLHLATLLLAAGDDLAVTALARIPAPPGVDESGWWRIIRSMARKRPFLWRNHCHAIDRGYLRQGTSSAVSFPTGGGKSTLAELKIATALLRGERVIFLAPTRALVSQTAKALSRTFQDADVIGELGEEVTFADLVVLPEVMVTTPEQCLLQLSIQPDAFADIGLVVFDECHLIHPREDDRSRRGLDAMLTVINLAQLAPNADFLMLSAMMKNAKEIAGWVAEMTGRPCLDLDLSWKPTRQIRGCVVYPSDEVTALKGVLSKARSGDTLPNSLPSNIAATLRANVFGLFSLLQTWSTIDRDDYTLLPLLEKTALLKTGGTGKTGWYLTPNGNETSTAIASAAVAAGMKTLVFLGTTVFCESCVRKFKDHGLPRPVVLTDEEKKWRALTVEELGGAEYCFLPIDEDGTLRAGAASHHSLLTREERELHESLFRRRDGVDVMFATSTLAQGMNLPGDVVIISGDSRFDPNADKMRKLEAHELLNAAGRAGRAGEGARGFVLLVPSRVIDFDNDQNKINGHWMELQSIFEQADQCLEIDDPLKEILDHIHAGLPTGSASYLLSKLPLNVGGEAEDPAKKLLSRSLAAFRARRDSNQAWLDSRVSAALAARPTAVSEPDKAWLEMLGTSTGLPVSMLADLLVLTDAMNAEPALTSDDLMSRLLDWLAADLGRTFRVLRPDSVASLFGGEYEKLESDEERAKSAISRLRLMTPLWMSGVPLCQIEEKVLERKDKLKKCQISRHFASSVSSELAFLAGLPARLLLARSKAAGVDVPITTKLAVLGACMRQGCDGPESLAVRIENGNDVSRVAARRRFDEIISLAGAADPYEDFETTRERMRHAEIATIFDDLT